MSKYFVIDPKQNPLSKKDIDSLHSEFLESNDSNWSKREGKIKETIQEFPPLKATQGRVVIKIDTQFKNNVAFNGTTIRLERQFNNLNRRETEPVNAIVVDAENIPTGAEVLVHHNSCSDTNRIFGAEKLLQGDVSPDIKYFSIKDNECFLWRNSGEEWQPCTIFATALRVFKPYTGVLENIPHTKIKDTLYVTSGELKGKVVATTKASDYCIVFNDEKGVEHSVIRFRPFGDIENEREEEAIAVLDELTLKVNKKELFLGINEKDCKPLNN